MCFSSRLWWEELKERHMVFFDEALKQQSEETAAAAKFEVKFRR